MKALTLTQPWATLVAIEAKRIETRSWQTHYRGPLAIHAAKGLAGMRQRDFVALCGRAPFAPALAAAGYRDPADLPRGAIVAVAELVAIERIEAATMPDEPERSFGDYRPGRYAWHLAGVRRLVSPRPARGALGLWSVELSLSEEDKSDDLRA